MKYLILTSLFIIITCKQEVRKSAPNLIDEPSFEKLVISQFEEIVAGIIPTFYPQNDFYPKKKCRISNQNCHAYMNDIFAYINQRGVKNSLRVEFYNDEDEFGKVDLNFPNVIFISCLLENYHSNEIKRTLIHEFAHLANPIKSAHGNKKNCIYFSSMALVCEYCFTGMATLLPNNIKLSNSIMENGKCKILHD